MISLWADAKCFQIYAWNRILCEKLNFMWEVECYVKMLIGVNILFGYLKSKSETMQI